MRSSGSCLVLPSSSSSWSTSGRRRIRDRYTAAEYNEAIGLRRHYVQDGGSLPDGILHPEPMPVGTAVYIVGVIAVERLFALGVIALIVYAAVS